MGKYWSMPGYVGPYKGARSSRTGKGYICLDCGLKARRSVRQSRASSRAENHRNRNKRGGQAEYTHCEKSPCGGPPKRVLPEDEYYESL